MLSALIAANSELLNQAETLLVELSAREYRARPLAQHESSIGAHLRHVLDHYRALLSVVDGHLDYDARRRECAVEFEPEAALADIGEIRRQLEQLTEHSLTVSCEIDSAHQHSVCVTSTLSRELMFNASHATHHYALIALLARALGKTLPEGFGVAPATLSYRRQRLGTPCVH
ncbi:MAG: DinB family protein [Gammaproteobacteria bacterium]|nr:DinB family protein [Gammaproteobacteria bacterium]